MCMGLQVLWEDNFKPWNYGTTSVTQRDILKSAMPKAQFKKYKDRKWLGPMLDPFKVRTAAPVPYLHIAGIPPAPDAGALPEQVNSLAAVFA